MKYIKTKDGIYRNASFPDDLVIICRGRECEINPSDILKQADTIEELCDRVAVKDFTNKEPRIYKPNKYNWKEIANTLFNARKVEWVKFAIWTDKGLIYVARMNDKGELELI